MPVLPPSTLQDIPKKDRPKVERMQYERSVLGYAFSFEGLMSNIQTLVTKAVDEKTLPDPEEIKEAIKRSVAAFNEDEAKTAKSRLNDKLQGIYLANGIKTLRDVDPFGRRKDYILIESTSTSFKKDEAIEIALKRYRIPAKTMTAIFEAATHKTPFTTMQARDVKEGNGDEG